MHPVEALVRHGGAARWGQLLQLTTRNEVRRLVARGDIVSDARGRLSLPTADQAVRAANAVSGVVSYRSAAAYWGWETKVPPRLPEVSVARSRTLSPERCRLVLPHWVDLAPDEVVDGTVTSPRRTLTDCLTRLPLDEALAIADSALRHDAFSGPALVSLTAQLRGPGAARARRVAAAADGRAANPFESVLRALALEVRGLDVEPQVVIAEPGVWARPDLVDREHRIVLEADSHTWHSSRQALRRDCRRYTDLTVHGWTVLRFAWEDVMHEPASVRAALLAVVGLAHQRAQQPRKRRAAA